MTTVRDCAAALNRLYDLDERHGGTTIYALATQMVSGIRTALARATYTSGVGNELRAVAALTAEHAGWLAYDSGRSEDARRWWLEALHLGDLAGNSDARVTALVSMALQASTAEDPAAGREAVDLMNVARSTGVTMSPRLASLVSARQAAGYARVGDQRASVKAMTAAERFLDQGDSDEDEPTWLHFWGPADLSCHRARALLALDDPAGAEVAAAAAQAACDENTYPRNHTIYGAIRATALTRSGRIDEAIAAATPVVARVSTLGSRRIVAEARGVVRQLGKYQAYGPAASFTAWADMLLPAA
jgi:hypothetical protein